MNRAGDDDRDLMRDGTSAARAAESAEGGLGRRSFVASIVLHCLLVVLILVAGFVSFDKKRRNPLDELSEFTVAVPPDEPEAEPEKPEPEPPKPEPEPPKPEPDPEPEPAPVLPEVGEAQVVRAHHPDEQDEVDERFDPDDREMDGAGHEEIGGDGPVGRNFGTGIEGGHGLADLLRSGQGGEHDGGGAERCREQQPDELADAEGALAAQAHHI